jgi:hypothetical protein
VLDLFDEFKAVISVLTERGVEYAVCGAIAMAVYNLPRATVDIDLLIKPDDFDKAKSAVGVLGYGIEANPMTFAKGAIEIRRLSKLDPDIGDMLMLDFLLVTPQIAPVWDSRSKIEWEEGSLCVVSREGLISLKSLRNSSQDIADIDRLQEESQ